MTLDFNLPAAAERQFRDGWILGTLDTIDSTNAAAAKMPPWHALRARTQTGGRGRTGKHWVSDQGGLWLSAVLPCPTREHCWSFLPLAIGWGVVQALRELGVSGVRLRWPNDLMVGRKKLAGVLVERYTPETIVVGIGLNVFNSPEKSRPELAGMTVRLADLVAEPGALDDIALCLLRAVRRSHEHLLAQGFAALVTALNDAWSQPRWVELFLAGKNQPVRGRFGGIDPEGRLRLCSDAADVQCFDATQVALLREVD